MCTASSCYRVADVDTPADEAPSLANGRHSLRRVYSCLWRFLRRHSTTFTGDLELCCSFDAPLDVRRGSKSKLSGMVTSCWCSGLPFTPLCVCKTAAGSSAPSRELDSARHLPICAISERTLVRYAHGARPSPTALGDPAYRASRKPCISTRIRQICGLSTLSSLISPSATHTLTSELWLALCPRITPARPMLFLRCCSTNRLAWS
ncbi:hypothetical protein C2E23DRAFT_842641 [Lenzites betulinus]|nr:hypothetical protein C2E23DRAFT_842641 [Lenzites betulinus]